MLVRLLPMPTSRSRMLPFARIEVGVRWGRYLAADPKQGPEGIERIESPIEPERELVEVAAVTTLRPPIFQIFAPRTIPVRMGASPKVKILADDIFSRNSGFLRSRTMRQTPKATAPAATAALKTNNGPAMDCKPGKINGAVTLIAATARLMMIPIHHIPPS